MNGNQCSIFKHQLGFPGVMGIGWTGTEKLSQNCRMRNLWSRSASRSALISGGSRTAPPDGVLK